MNGEHAIRFGWRSLDTNGTKTTSDFVWWWPSMPAQHNNNNKSWNCYWIIDVTERKSSVIFVCSCWVFCCCLFSLKILCSVSDWERPAKRFLLLWFVFCNALFLYFFFVCVLYCFWILLNGLLLSYRLHPHGCNWLNIIWIGKLMISSISNRPRGNGISWLGFGSLSERSIAARICAFGEQCGKLDSTHHRKMWANRIYRRPIECIIL